MKRLLGPIAVAAVLVGLIAPRLGAHADVPDATVAPQIDARHSGGLPADALTPPLEQKWAVDVDGELDAPLIAGGRIFAMIKHPDEPGSTPRGPDLAAFDAASGGRDWQMSLGPNNAAFVYDAAGGIGRLFVTGGSNDPSQNLRAFDAATGAQLWTAANGGIPTAVDGTLYVTASNSQGQAALDEITGAVRWTAQTYDDGWSPAVTDGSAIRALGCNGADAYSVATGAQLWKVKSDCTGGGGLPVVSDGRLYALNNYPFWEVQPWIFDSGSGNVLGHFNANRSPAFENNIGVFSYNGIVQAEDMLTGAPLWSFTGDCSLTAPPIMVHG